MVDFTVYKGVKGGKIVETTTRKELGPHDVLLKVTHSGLCYTDVHFKENDMVLGHEGAGIVEQVGSAVTLFKKGDRTGWGYIHNTCGHCKQCLTGVETFCPEVEMYGTADFDQGSFASHAIWNENYLFKVPDALELEDAAPLMCGGATVFNAMMHHGIKSTDRVGVIGVGGLGHLAIQFAAKFGCEVAVFSSTDSKKEEATKLGATEFYATKGAKKLEVKAPIDILVSTTSHLPDWSLFIDALAPQATILPLTAGPGDFSIPNQTLINKGLRVQGSLVAARQMHRDMLEFATFHGIKPMIQKFPMSEEGITKAFETLQSGKMTYRGVLVGK